jgi:hypothetical protein
LNTHEATSPAGDFVGTIGFKGDVESSTVDIAPIRFVPEAQVNALSGLATVWSYHRAQRTHVSTQSIALVLRYAFETLGMRRVGWKTDLANERSARAAERLGFRDEGIIRWHHHIPDDGRGETFGLRAMSERGLGSPSRGLGQHQRSLALCWDDWENEMSDKVAALAARPPMRMRDPTVESATP